MNVLAVELFKYYESVEPYDFYREIFGDGELDTADAFTKGKYTAIALEITNEQRIDKKTGKKKQIVYRHTVTDDLDVVDELQYSKHFCIMAPISYAGKSRVSKNARMMYALGVELDNLRVTESGQQLGLENLIDRYADRAHWIPKPTFIVASGNGVHLYYQFEKPLVLFPNTIESLKRYKVELTRMIWSESVTTDYTEDKIQQESIFQGFRMPGTPTRKGDKAVAFRVGDKVSIDYMNSFMRPSFKGKNDIQGTYKSDLTLREAREKYPDWYEKVIVNGDHSVKEWALSRNVYDWWLREIKAGAVDGHRYHCLQMLAIYAIKCGNYDEKKNPNPVTQEEFEYDAWSLLEDFNARGKRADNPFTEYDVMCAIQTYEDRGYITYPRNSVSYKSGITLIPNKRNGRTQEQHLKLARFARDLNYDKGESWRDNSPHSGRKKKNEIVQEWKQLHPDGKKIDCARETGLHINTVYKWWNTEREKSMSEVITKKYIEEQYELAVMEYKTACSEDEQWEVRKTMARLERIAMEEYGFDYADELACMKSVILQNHQSDKAGE